MTIFHGKQDEVLNIEVFPSLFTGEYPYHKSEHGINFWGHDTGTLKIIKEDENRAIIRESGRHWRSGLGNFPYVHPRYYIGIYGLGKGDGREITDCLVVFYSIEYSSKTANMAKELTMELFESLEI